MGYGEAKSCLLQSCSFRTIWLSKREVMHFQFVEISIKHVNRLHAWSGAEIAATTPVAE